MKQYGMTESTLKPQAISVDDKSVWVASEIKETSRKDERSGENMTLYQYQLAQYGKDEYIQTIGTQVLDTQDALAEIYQSMSGS